MQLLNVVNSQLLLLQCTAKNYGKEYAPHHIKPKEKLLL